VSFVHTFFVAIATSA